ncbi:unnamed protein product [Blepharisma stoltei]|uniref:Uncharacterized protein n=1 Tax=Blepharisma stoltei TaxID=1481888 RepID=A0AAU9JEB2_9CILI|nr:unnamed protein product [Blepharisma stoltei]
MYTRKNRPVFFLQFLLEKKTFFEKCFIIRKKKVGFVLLPFYRQKWWRVFKNVYQKKSTCAFSTVFTGKKTIFEKCFIGI